MESFQALKVMIEFKFIHVQEAHGVSSFNWNQFENKGDLCFRRKMDAVFEMLET